MLAKQVDVLYVYIYYDNKRLYKGKKVTQLVLQDRV